MRYHSLDKCSASPPFTHQFPVSVSLAILPDNSRFTATILRPTRAHDSLLATPVGDAIDLNGARRDSGPAPGYFATFTCVDCRGNELVSGTNHGFFFDEKFLLPDSSKLFTTARPRRRFSLRNIFKIPQKLGGSACWAFAAAPSASGTA